MQKPQISPLLGIGAFLSVVGQPISAASQTPIREGVPIMANQKYVLDAADIPRLREDALKGSGEEALRLAMFFDLVAIDLDQGLYWKTIAVENGSVLAMYNLAQTLRSKADPESKVRARYWFERVVKVGQQPLAGEAEQRLKDMEK